MRHRKPNGIALRWEHLDREVAAKLIAVIGPANGRAKPRTPSFDLAGTLTTACMALLLVGLYVSISFHWGGPRVTLLLIALPTALGAVFRAVRESSAVRGDFGHGKLPLQGRPLADAFVSAPLTSSERLYADLVLQLSVSDGRQASPATDRRKLLRDCTALLGRYNGLERHRKRLLDFAKIDSLTQALTAVDREYADLQGYFQPEPDTADAISLQDRVARCVERRETLRALEPLHERLAEEQENIREALLSIQAALANTERDGDVSARIVPHRRQEGEQRIAGLCKAVDDACTEFMAR